MNDFQIRELLMKEEFIKIAKNYFERCNAEIATNILIRILKEQKLIKVTEIDAGVKSFHRWNLGKFDEDVLKPEVISYLENKIKEYIQHNFEQKEMLPDEDASYPIYDNITYRDFRKMFCDQLRSDVFKYNFANSKLPIEPIENKFSLQRCQIQILSNGQPFNLPIGHAYQCNDCGHITYKKDYEVTGSTTAKIFCENMIALDNGKFRRCKMSISPDHKVSKNRTCILYDISYDNANGEKVITTAISFLTLQPGYYECVLLNIGTHYKKDFYHIIDIKELFINNVFELPKQKQEENYIFSLQKSIDKFIYKQSGIKIYGLIPIKAAIIMQSAIVHINKDKLDFNIQVVGDPSTGKSLLFKYYLFMINGHLNLSTNGLSVSVAALRGTRQTLSFFDKDLKIISIGHLGTFKSIHIDEAGENKELITNLKTFLFENNYGYHKSDGASVLRTKTCHINLTENISNDHLGQYRGSVRKNYKDMQIKISEIEKPHWDETWDLFQPLIHYKDNPYLFKCISDVRESFMLKKQFWIDGYDLALHERFPFYFYIVHEKQNNQKLIDIIIENVSENVISENYKLMWVLKNNELVQYFKSIEPFINKKFKSVDSAAFNKVNEILKTNGVQCDIRVREYYYRIVQMSRALNKREHYEQMDFDFLQYILNHINRKTDVGNMDSYEVKKPIDGDGGSTMKMIEDESKKIEDMFGLPKGEF